MRVVLFLLSLGVFFLSIMTLVAAKSAVHEIAGYVLLLISAVFFVGSAIVDAIVAMREDLKPKSPPEPEPKADDPRFRGM